MCDLYLPSTYWGLIVILEQSFLYKFLNENWVHRNFILLDVIGFL